jgi:hypothetical protein
MALGISTNRNCEAIGSCLRDAGKSFVVRYHSARTTQPEKRLRPREAAELARAGLDLACVYQDNALLPEDFGRARGVEDGQAAFAAAGQVGQPPGSGLYFAVDHDFSLSETRSFVLPYFEGVRTGLMEAANAQAVPFRIGVYGSGLTCQIVKDNEALAELSWLAESTGWRGSANYDGWDLRQQVNTASLCTLGSNWEANESRGDFGAFRPIGADITAGSGDLMAVTAPELFLRHVPSTQGNVPILRMHEGQLVRVLGPAAPPFLRVRVSIQGNDVIGYASGRFLAPAGARGPAPAPTPMPANAPVPSPVPATVFTPPAVHFREGDPQSRRASTARRAQPLGEPGQPQRDAAAPAAQRVAQIQAIIDWLDVANSARYAATPLATFCNVYAADFCYLAGVYLPRTWWKEASLLRMAAGAPAPAALYDDTVRELRADDLLAWLQTHGSGFGWRQVFDCTALQQAANGGGVGLICADRATEGRPGHIVAVVPETASVSAKRDADGFVTLPVQSQAGAFNSPRFVGAQAWWDDLVTYRDRGYFVHD